MEIRVPDYKFEYYWNNREKMLEMRNSPDIKSIFWANLESILERSKAYYHNNALPSVPLGINGTSHDVLSCSISNIPRMPFLIFNDFQTVK